MHRKRLQLGVLIACFGLLAVATPQETYAAESRLQKHKRMLAKVRKDKARQQAEINKLRKKAQKAPPPATTSPALKKAEKAFAQEETKYLAAREARLERLLEISDRYRQLRATVKAKTQKLKDLDDDEDASPKDKASVLRAKLEAISQARELEDAFLKDDDELRLQKDQLDLASYKVQSEKKKLLDAARNDPIRDRIEDLLRGIKNNERAEESLAKTVANLERQAKKKK